MSTSHIYHTQGIRNFHYKKEEYVGNTVKIYICRHLDKFRCPDCGSSNVLIIKDGQREIKGLKSGKKQTSFIVDMHRIKCRDCGCYKHEKLEFISSPKVHYTRGLERSIIELRKEMYISALAKYFDLHWSTVKDIEKRHLGRKYRKIKLKDVKYIGIDEVYVGHKKYLTVVRDMESGAVLYIGDGKGGDALAGFAKQLRHSKCKIEAAAVDLAPSYTAWLKEILPDSDIVYDHFHLIKLMNEKINSIRGYWRHNKLTSAGMEGFNNKIGWLNRQAYGYRDNEYFKLKIFDLPTVTLDKAI